MFARAATLCIISLSVPALWAQDVSFTIRVLNGKTGRPVAGQRLLLFGGATPDEVRFHKINLDVTTDPLGRAEITVNPGRVRIFEVWPDFMTRCAPHVETFSTGMILQSGEVSPNACSKTVSAHGEAGELTFYIRQPTLREKMNR